MRRFTVGPEEFVTFQIAFVASDGFVIASDTKISDERCGIRTGSLGPKIFTPQDDGIILACACSDGADLAFQAKDKLFARLERSTPLPLARMWSELSQIGCEVKAIAAAANSQASGSLLVAYWDAGMSTLLRLDISREDSMCERVYDRAAVASDALRRVTGDRLNSSVFFSEQYYEPQRVVDDLIFLAAHTVVMAGKRNPEFVQGLEILKCKDGILYRLSKEEIETLRRRSADLDSKIRSTLFEREGSGRALDEN